ncbi:hypothetical protein [Microbacterium immunditiarum]|uniref:Peptidase S1 domain-containing protein n=1 Tax=Microbacterium immunditiarum TaxID=337480 RepID=A0A7Y9GNZ8_9MICO|nr:hypothetical protein [Microbacterium immunditiarum]NYE20012.1 hypothetical protein [Microbacterium immunditiarum]
MQVGNPDLPVNTYEWDRDSQTLLIYSTMPESKWAPLLKEHLPEQAVKIIPAVHSKTDIDAALRAMGEDGGVLANGGRIVTAVPAKDGSTIAVGVEPAVGARMDTNAIAKELDVGIPVTVDVAADVQPATRNIGYYVNFFSGAYMQSATTGPNGRSCSTGFRIGRFSDNAAGMLSAEHCGRDYIGKTWYYSSTSNSSSNIGNFQGMMSVSSVAATDTGLWTGGNVAVMYPAVFTGNHTDGGTLEQIRGANIAVVGNHVCYSGSRSGNACSNEVTATGTLVCYSITQCYYGTTWTSQTSSIEAAGNGDSGGPVYRRVDGKVYASGIISGIVGGSQTCTGDPGSSTRSCSPVALYAPVDVALGSSTGWGLAYVP